MTRNPREPHSLLFCSRFLLIDGVCVNLTYPRARNDPTTVRCSISEDSIGRSQPWLRSRYDGWVNASARLRPSSAEGFYAKVPCLGAAEAISMGWGVSL